MNREKLTISTPLLDFTHPQLQTLIISRKWQGLPTHDGIGAVYDFVRDEIEFGYNHTDDIPASDVLKDGYGQCNTKAILLMALLRAIGVPTRFHGFTIDKSLQRGVVPELIYPITPANIIHSWVEIFHDDRWINLEGFILDTAFLDRLKSSFRDVQGFCGYGVGTDNLQNPGINWTGRNTYIQSTAINQDFGLYDSPDEFFATHSQDFPWWKKILFSRILRHWMNRRVRNIRDGGTVAPLPASKCARIPIAQINLARAPS